MVKTLPSEGVLGLLGGLNPFSGGTWTLRVSDTPCNFDDHLILPMQKSGSKKATLPDCLTPFAPLSHAAHLLRPFGGTCGCLRSR